MSARKSAKHPNLARRLADASLAVHSTVDVVDLFCGCGGLSLGFQKTPADQVKFRILGGIDLDTPAIMTYAHQIGAATIRADVREFRESRALKQLRAKFGVVADRPLVVIGGPPCQGFSAHRKKDRRTDKRNDLLGVFTEVALSLSPEFIVMENVPEIFDRKHFAHYAAARALLERSGYRVRARIYNVADFGVPQDRFRALVIARRAGRAFNMPEPVIHNRKTVRDAIEALPQLSSGAIDPADSMHVAPSHTSRILRLIASIPRDGGSRRDANPSDLPRCHSTVDGFRDVYGRLAWDRPSISITAKSSTPSCGRFLHPEQDRNISVREAALLQGFPKDFIFSGPLIQKYRQIGNAVSPLFAKKIAICISEQLVPPAEICGLEQDVTDSIGKSFTSTIAGIKKRHASRVTTSSNRVYSKVNSAPRLIDCFSGAGGLSLGLQQAGFQPMFAFDHDPDAVATYRANIGPHIQLSDSRYLTVEKILRRSGLEVGECDLLAGGPPCQGFSQQGRGLENDPRNELVVWYARLIAAMRPKFYLLENVPYLKSKRGKAILDRFLKILDGEYHCTSDVLNAVDFGVPQNRQRLFVVGVRKDVGKPFCFPAPRAIERLSVKDAIGELPSPPPVGSGEHPDFANHIRTAISPLNELRISRVPPGGGWQDIPKRLQLACHQDHRGHGHIDVYGRLRWDRPAHTLTALCDSFTRGRYAHPSEHRPITGREAAALQSFPHYFRFLADKKSVARLIGNAVPPRLAAMIGRAIRAHYEISEVGAENYRMSWRKSSLETIHPFATAAE